jgi:hypothetical protein
LQKIRGKKIVFNACTKYRKEVTVIGWILKQWQKQKSSNSA